MAQSPAHQWGQIVGHVLESAIEPLLQRFADEHGLYLDKESVRPVRKGRKVSWTDLNGNRHDLDFVLEKGGTAERQGTPIAFIETAWRRYTKHSRNKAQEIQGAILPLAASYREAAPFIGAVLAGEFTVGALIQLRSLGFQVVHFPYRDIVDVFAAHDLDASSNERTSDVEFARKVEAWKRLDGQARQALARALLERKAEELRSFMDALTAAVTRKIEVVRILALHGTSAELPSIEEAIAFIQSYSAPADSWPLIRFEVEIRYANGDRVDGEFSDQTRAVRFLQTYQQPQPTIES